MFCLINASKRALIGPSGGPVHRHARRRERLVSPIAFRGNSASCPRAVAPPPPLAVVVAEQGPLSLNSATVAELVALAGNRPQNCRADRRLSPRARSFRAAGATNRSQWYRREDPRKAPSFAHRGVEAHLAGRNWACLDLAGTKATGIHISGQTLRVAALDAGRDGLRPLVLATEELDRPLDPAALSDEQQRQALADKLGRTCGGVQSRLQQRLFLAGPALGSRPASAPHSGDRARKTANNSGGESEQILAGETAAFSCDFALTSQWGFVVATRHRALDC